MKKILVILLLMIVPTYSYSQNYEVYVGSVINEQKEMHPGYLLGANFMVDLHQDRRYLNSLLLGFEHSAFMSGNMVITPEQSNIENSTPTIDCGCTSTDIGFGNGNSQPYTLKKEVRAVSLNFGVKVFKGKRFYLITGVTNYQHITKINNEKVNEYRTMQIDAGIKYFIKAKHWFFSPMIKFNPETLSFGIGASFK